MNAQPVLKLIGGRKEMRRVLEPGAVLPAEVFLSTLVRERKRAERSGHSFLLVCLDLSHLRENNGYLDAGLRDRLFSVLHYTLRETDVVGWHETNRIAGAILTELGDRPSDEARRTIRRKVESRLDKFFPPLIHGRILVSVHCFPDDRGHELPNEVRKALYPDLIPTSSGSREKALLKRGLDIAGSLALILALSPLFLLIALAVKLTSKGPVLFRQERLGQFGHRFKLLKFRSMYVGSDPSIHQKYIQEFVKQGKSSAESQEGKPVFKLVKDPRITKVGRFLRKSSLDELPQFFNVLKGDMSLVGPRPPIPYELKEYDLWHRRRVVETMPGITGLWQVYGRSRTTFDEMVRMDLNYARNWSLWLDVKLLLQTPLAVIKGQGAV